MAVRMILGRNFAERDDPGLEAFQFAETFVGVTEEGSGRLRHETLAVGDHDPEDGTPEILTATRNE